MEKGISSEIPNEHESLLGEVPKPIVFSGFSWHIGSGKSYMTN